MKVSQKVAQVYELQKNISRITKEVENNPYVVYEVRKHNQSKTRLISTKLYDELMQKLEELEMLNDPELVASLIQSDREFNNGQGIALDEVLREMKAENV